MAGIEKVCEYSGEYPGHDMYNWKRNSIQVMPKYRKLFRGAEVELIFDRSTADLFRVAKGNHFKYNTLEENYQSDPYYYSRVSGILCEYTYTLLVKNPELQGEVGGEYVNYSYKPKTVLRKMKRLTRNYRLKIKWVN